jgi:DMSO/TMAO reductase YedYZ molybdopterin-dependent catalytic subunit
MNENSTQPAGSHRQDTPDDVAKALRAPSQHPLPDVLPDAARWRLRVDGLVTRPLALALDDLRALPRLEHEGSFTCERGWEDGQLRWQGAALSAVLALAEPSPSATALYAHSGDFRSLVPLATAPGAFLAYQLAGQALTVERGAPCRLIVVDPESQLSLKWVDRLELIHAAPEEPAGPRRPPA